MREQHVTWRTACDSSACVEVAVIKSEWISGCDSVHCVKVMETHTRVLVRDSKNPDGPQLNFSHDEWEQFIAGVKEGKFDL